MHEFFNDWRNIMGMICYYFRADEDMMKKIRERGVHIIFSEKYEKNLLNIEKTWDAIQYVLRKTQFETKEDEYVRHLISGGEMVNEEDLGYGPASFFTKEQTVRLNNILNKWDKEMFRKNFHIKSFLYMGRFFRNKADFRRGCQRRRICYNFYLLKQKQDSKKTDN